MWDAVNDPLIAGYMDTLDSRFGKFRPYMLFTPVLIVLVTVAAFYNIDADTSTKVMYAGITYILWGTLYTISDVPFWSMSSVMTDEPQERAKAATCAMLGVNAGIGATLVVFPKLSAYFADGRADQGYLPAVIVLMIAGLFFMLNGFYNTKERISTKSCEKVTLKQTFQAVRKNKPLFFYSGSVFHECVFQSSEWPVHFLLHIQHGRCRVSLSDWYHHFGKCDCVFGYACADKAFQKNVTSLLRCVF